MKKSSRIFIIIIGLLLVSNAATIVLYKHYKAESSSSVEAAEEVENNEQQSEAKSEEQSSESTGESVPQRSEPFIAVADYDTEDAAKIIDRLARAGYDSERVGSTEDFDVNKYDAVIIPGGHSVDPEMYGAERQPETKDTDIEKDKFQFAVVQSFIDEEKPVLGICRGEQLVNNVLGGTTIQHMEDGWHKLNRPVRIAEGSWLYDMFGTEAVTYHYHHQCVDELGEGLYATQWDSESGCIEAYEHKTLPVYGLQWHPDATEMGETGVNVFAAFGELVKENMAERQAKG